MKPFATATAAACLTAFAAPALAVENVAHNPANTIRLEEGHPDNWRNFAPELPAMRARAPEINTDYGLHVSEIEPGLFFVTDLVYQSAFLVTDEGVVVFDAPPSFGPGLRKAVDANADGVPITHFILSHGHGDHNRGGFHFADIDGLEIIAAAEVAETLKRQPLEGVLQPNRTFDNALELTVGGVPIQLDTMRFHSEDTDVIAYLPQQSFLIAIDTITPGEAPFMNFGATTDLAGYWNMFDTVLSYEFVHFMSGHVTALGTRDDVITARDYTLDVRDTVFGLMAGFNDRMGAAMQATEFSNANLAYRMAMEGVRDECAAGVIDRWQDQLSVVDLWAASHCETTILFAITH